MSDFPKWLLALAGVSLLPVLLSPLYLFGATPFGTSDYRLVQFLLYCATQLLWLLPLVLFFVSLDYYRRGFERAAVAVAAVSALVACAGLAAVFLL